MIIAKVIPAIVPAENGKQALNGIMAYNTKDITIKQIAMI
jgi:hypothetical protein